ncbi:MAG: magnesium/cobalt transporter CorA [Candidatus Aadella gelida]|nr:magnesium/cobalt transporter CorA [Candidatus Aadella gelida]
MSKLIKKQSKTAGQVPGTLVYVGEKRAEKPNITVIDYGKEHFEEKGVKNIEEYFGYKGTNTITWINVNGLQDIELIQELGGKFDIHQLVLEDIVNTGQRPKMEDSDNYIFIVLKMIYFDESKNDIVSEQVSLILAKNFVITFQEKEGDVFDGVRERIRKAKGRIRNMGTDYLAYTIIDAVVDNYFVVMENISEKIEGMENGLINNPTPENLQTIHGLKRDIIFLRKTVWPLREVISGIEKNETPLIQKKTLMYFRDVYDHTIQVIDTIESFRDTVSGLLDIYMSSISNRMNEVMKVLTIIATIFIPITFVAGIYGMNFDPSVSKFNMPELGWPFGYIFALGIMGVIAIGMLVYFRRKKWL